ncbi:MAG TPA: hypothetical protein VL485_16880 [Ktedonobacteraceae bacterium]|jgi:hypothetical protein|nr:hypothetical protein [Ktedonobacteraceae bacterium]
MDKVVGVPDGSPLPTTAYIPRDAHVGLRHPSRASRRQEAVWEAIVMSYIICYLHFRAQQAHYQHVYESGEHDRRDC